LRAGRPYFWRALFDVTSGGEFWMVAVGPAKWAILGLSVIMDSFFLSGLCCPAAVGPPALPWRVAQIVR
jgi:hypothetical protein